MCVSARTRVCERRSVRAAALLEPQLVGLSAEKGRGWREKEEERGIYEEIPDPTERLWEHGGRREERGRDDRKRH